MAKVKEITIISTYKRGFENVFGNFERTLIEVITLEDGDDAEKVKATATARQRRQIQNEVHSFVEANDVKELPPVEDVTPSGRAVKKKKRRV